ncbi:MAG: hypothetical protein LBU19_09530 [Treponema sp.]|jgi:hypothetical protein|nr:hypothetical protein [Treponema sp.]
MRHLFIKAVLPEPADEEIEELDITDPHLKPEFSGDKLVNWLRFIRRGFNTPPLGAVQFPCQ